MLFHAQYSDSYLFYFIQLKRIFYSLSNVQLGQTQMYSSVSVP